MAEALWMGPLYLQCTLRENTKAFMTATRLFEEKAVASQRAARGCSMVPQSGWRGD